MKDNGGQGPGWWPRRWEELSDSGSVLKEDLLRLAGRVDVEYVRKTGVRGDLRFLA